MPGKTLASVTRARYTWDMLTSVLTPTCAATRAPLADFARLSNAFQIVASCAKAERKYRFSATSYADKGFADTLAADAATLYNMSIVADFDPYANPPKILAELPHECHERLTSDFRRWAARYADYHPLKSRYASRADDHAARAAYLHAGGTF